MSCTHMSLVIQLLTILSVLFTISATERAIAGVPAIIVFGDSTVDAGNNNQIPTLLKSNFRPYGRDFKFNGGKPTGRFSNGRLATDFYSEAMGLGPIVPAYLDPECSIEDFVTGVCFASAGTGIDVATSDVLSVIPLWKQVSYFKEYQDRLRSYLGGKTANQTISEALYIISIGTNDFVENYYSPTSERSAQFSIDQFEDFLIGLAREFITNIYHLGARRIAFTGLSPMGCVPLERTTNFLNGGTNCLEEYNKVARDFNVKLEKMIRELNWRLPGIQLKLAAAYDFILHVIQNPSLYGFENVEVGCCASGAFEIGYLCNEWNPLTCTDATKYAFWDAVHPTERLSYIVANHLINSTLVQLL